MIDLHIHTTASDGRHAPAAVVRLAAQVGLGTIAITDHDTLTAWPEASGAAASLGVRLLTGVEITAVLDGRDVHVLGYGIDPRHGPLAAFLEQQRNDRVARVREISRRLAFLGVPVDIESVLTNAAASGGRAVGRPAVARALVDAGHAVDANAAFNTWLGFGRPAFVPRTGTSPAGVVAVIRGARGLSSLAHPLLLKRDDLIAPLADAGLDAIEVYHSEHRPEDVERYHAFARQLGLAITGGSDFHGDPAHGNAHLGSVVLPAAELERLDVLLERRAPAHAPEAANGRPHA